MLEADAVEVDFFKNIFRLWKFFSILVMLPISGTQLLSQYKKSLLACCNFYLSEQFFRFLGIVMENTGATS